MFLRTKQVYSEEFCLEVVKQSDKKQSTLVALAHKFGVSLQQVQYWCIQIGGLN